MKTLKRKSNGFVLYPKDLPKRTLDGCSRFRTRCDHLVGPCSCGLVHQEQELLTISVLEEHGLELDTLTLYPDVDGRVAIPRYWNRLGTRHVQCDTLLGQCVCGKSHKITDRWVGIMLAQHNAVIHGVDGPKLDLSTVEQRDPYRQLTRFDI